MPDLVIKEDQLFLVSGENGDVAGGGAPQGLYFHDTRYLSGLRFMVGGEQPVLLFGSAADGYQMRFVYRSQRTRAGELLKHQSIGIERRRLIWDGVLYEHLVFTNYTMANAEIDVAMTFENDFRDLFEARGSVRKARGQYLPTEAGADRMRLSYRGLDDVVRRVQAVATPMPARFTPQPALPAAAHPTAGAADSLVPGGEAVWTLSLASGQSVPVTLAFSLDRGDSFPAVLPFAEALSRVQHSYDQWRDDCAAIETDNPGVNRTLERSLLDMKALLTDGGHGRYPVAGIPIYAVLYGRDSLITSLEMLPVNPAIAVGALRSLAALQGEENNAYLNEEPGKIPHEIRPGEMGRLLEIPFGRYYGTVDATPLFLVLLAQYYAWTGDMDLVRELLPNVKAALQWMDQYGDSDGDLLQEYQADEAGIGLQVQSWKDSHYSMCHRDGTRAKSPVAVSEVQGYAYDAKRRLAPILEQLGETALAQQLSREAALLRERFNHAFWMEDRQFMAIALDGEKQQVGTVSSDIGHCLWSGIVEPSLAGAIAQRLVAPDLFSGWGIRTLSSAEKTYNPMSYHNGTVWPHDNALCIMGLKRYGYHEEANRVMEGQFAAANCFAYNRIPELYCGFDRSQGDPVLYPVACSPQAWSAAAPFAMVTAMLGLEPDAAAGVLRLRPSLPAWLQRLSVRGIRVGQAMADIEVTHAGGVVATVRQGQLRIIVEA